MLSSSSGLSPTSVDLSRVASHTPSPREGSSRGLVDEERFDISSVMSFVLTILTFGFVVITVQGFQDQVYPQVKDDLSLRITIVAAGAEDGCSGYAIVHHLFSLWLLSYVFSQYLVFRRCIYLSGD